jgi:hypothetical protein
MEAACKEKTGRTQSEIQKSVLANGSLFSHAVPTGPQASMDLWSSTLGLYQPKQQKYHTTVPE